MSEPERSLRVSVYRRPSVDENYLAYKLVVESSAERGEEKLRVEGYFFERTFGYSKQEPIF